MKSRPAVVDSLTGRQIALLAMLYLVQGLPFGFQVSALHIFLREQGVGLAAIGCSTAPRSVGAEGLWAPWWSGMEDDGGGCDGLCRFFMAAGFLVASMLHIPTNSGLDGRLARPQCLAATQDVAGMDWPSTSSSSLVWECGPGRRLQGRHALGRRGPGLGQRVAGLVGAFLVMAALVTVVARW